MIEITGYITETYRATNFTIKITDDNVIDQQGNHPEVSKEVKIYINPKYRPDDNHQRFIEVSENTYYSDEIEKCLSISRHFKKGDRVKCSVFIVTCNDYDNKTYIISQNPNDIETYTKFEELWLYPHTGDFKRLEVDTPQTLKFRKQNYYIEVNNRKCEEITGSSYHQYREKWWINKNPKITFPILRWIRIRTKTSKLWKKFTEQKNLTISHKIVLIISVMANIILALLSILLYFKKP